MHENDWKRPFSFKILYSQCTLTFSYLIGFFFNISTNSAGSSLILNEQIQHDIWFPSSKKVPPQNLKTYFSSKLQPGQQGREIQMLLPCLPFTLPPWIIIGLLNKSCTQHTLAHLLQLTMIS